MDKLVETSPFALQLPVWVIMHPTKKKKGYITMTAQPGQTVMPLFTEEQLAQRYRDGAPQLRDFLVGGARDATEITKVINAMVDQGFTHAAIDPTTKRGIRFSVDELRDVAAQSTANPVALAAPDATND
jgi:hypothetical protein